MMEIVEEEIDIVYVSVIAAMYTALTIALGFISYGPIQFRISDALLILPYHKRFGKSAIIGLTIGGFLGNIPSPYVPWDLLVGPVANFIAASIVYGCGELSRRVGRGSYLYMGLAITASLIGSILIALIVAYEIVIMELNVFEWGAYVGIVISVFIGELVAFVLGGAVLLNHLRFVMPEE